MSLQNVSYIDIRKAMIDGARTLEEIKEKQELLLDVVDVQEL